MYKTRRCAGSLADADACRKARSAAAQFLGMLHDFSARMCAGLPKRLRRRVKSAHFQGIWVSGAPKQQCKTFNKLARRALTESELGFNIALSIEAHQTSVTAPDMLPGMGTAKGNDAEGDRWQRLAWLHGEYACNCRRTAMSWNCGELSEYCGLDSVPLGNGAA